MSLISKERDLLTSCVSLSRQNNVFIQYNREADGSLRPLPAQHVDTGMGFERLTSILQDVDSNYDTDIFIPIFDAIQKVTGARSYAKKVGKDDPKFIDMAYRVVADHIRTLCFSIADGAVPSNEGRGYVLRRVLRRAVRYGRQNLGAELGFFSQLVPTVVEVMGGMFPELVERQAHVTAIIKDEEESFSRTLDKGIQRFKEMADNGDGKTFSGEDAHFLYTSMGFPIDLTELMCEERGLVVDKDAFEEKMKAEQELSAAAHLAKMAGGSGKDMRLVAEQVAYLVGKSIAGTNDDAKYTWNQDLEGCSVKALFIGRNETEDMIGFVDSITPDSNAIGVIMDKTSFYAEAGGQVYDTGVLTTVSGAEIRIDNVQSYGQYVLHVGQVVNGAVSVGDEIKCSVDYVRRAPIASNHTMTHVLNHALKEVLVHQGGSSTIIDQKGSLVDEFKLRFDFSWNGQLTPAQLADVERLCMERIANEVPVDAYVAPLADAEKISSLRAVFGEKYPDPVRVVSVANVTVPEMLANPQDSTWNAYSVEFCGGTHLTNTKEAEAFVLLSEEGIAKGIRRIVAVTKADARKAMAIATAFEEKLKAAESMKEEHLEEHAKVLQAELDGLSIAIVKKIQFREALAALIKKVIAFNKQKIAGMADEIADKAIAAANLADGIKVVIRADFGLDGKVSKNIMNAYSKQVKDKALMLISADASSDRFMALAYAPKDINIDCKAWVTAATDGTGAKGGGKMDTAQMTASGISNIDAVMEKARSYSS